jgi:hypothetical protein
MARKLTRAELQKRQASTIKAAVILGSLLCLGFTFLIFQIMSM